MTIKTAATAGAVIAGLGFSATGVGYELHSNWADSQKERQVGGIQKTRVQMSIDEKYVDAKLEVVEARTDAKFAQLLGELKGIASAQERLETKMTSVETEAKTWKWNLVMTGLALGGLILGLFAYGTQILELASGLVGAGAATGAS